MCSIVSAVAFVVVIYTLYYRWKCKQKDFRPYVTSIQQQFWNKKNRTKRRHKWIWFKYSFVVKLLGITNTLVQNSLFSLLKLSVCGYSIFVNKSNIHVTSFNVFTLCEITSQKLFELTVEVSKFLLFVCSLVNCVLGLVGCWSSVSVRMIIYKFLNVCPFDYTAFVVRWKAEIPKTGLTTQVG